MAQNQQAIISRFRTACGGFHKKDVVSYLVELTAEHQQTVEELKKQIALLEEDKTQACDRCARLEEENLQLRQRLEQSQEKTPEKNREPEVDLREQELEAYRRAEAAERRAETRLQRIGQRVNQLRQELTLTLSRESDDARGSLGAIQQQLEQVNGAMTRFADALDQSARELEAMAEGQEP